MSQDEVVTLTKLDKSVVARIIEDEEIADEIAREVFEKKVPTIKNIICLSLNAINSTLKEMATDENLRRDMMKKVSDIALLTRTVKDLNDLVRLELGQSTQNIAIEQRHTHTFQETRDALTRLKTIDPVFGDSYPELPPPKEDSEA